MISRILYYTSFVVIALTVTFAGMQMWRDAHHRFAALPLAVAIAPGGHLALATDRMKLERFEGNVMRWSVVSSLALDAIETTGDVVLGRAIGATSSPGLIIFDLATGHAKWAWAVPAGEAWAAAAPNVLGSCLVAMTLKQGDAVVRCLDASVGALRWTALITGGRECTRAPVAVNGAVLVQCAGWTTVIDDRSGAVSVDAGGISLVQREPAYLLRAGSPLTIAAWSPAEHRFAKQGEPIRGTNDFLSLSAVMHGDRLVMRAASSSDQLAIVSPKTGDVYVVASPDSHLADDAPFVLECGGITSPRFQLVELAPKLGAHFDPEAAQHRALALIDVATDTVSWTSAAIEPLHPIAAAALCRGNHYLVPVEVRGSVTSALWIVDAETGKTTRVLAFDGEGFGEVSAAQVDPTRLVGIAKGGPFELAWTEQRAVPRGLHDARAALERVLGPLP
ncbi:hypothetical protein BH11MYX1_BH11MYX1_41560 [soil metagenome]